MKYFNKVKTLMLLILVTVVFAEVKMAKAEATNKATEWNSPSLSFFANQQSKAELMSLLPEWDIQPMTWPSEEETGNYRGAATKQQKDQCLKEIKEYLKNEWVPEETEAHLLPLKKWAIVDGNWKEKGKADVFLCRYRINNYLIQITDGNWAIVITIKEITDTPPLKKDDHKKLVSKIFKTFWKGELSEMPLAQQQPPNITRGGLRSNKEVMSFITDGKFVTFNITKRSSPGTARMFPDPYQPMFSSDGK